MTDIRNESAAGVPSTPSPVVASDSAACDRANPAAAPRNLPAPEGAPPQAVGSPANQGAGTPAPLPANARVVKGPDLDGDGEVDAISGRIDNNFDGVTDADLYGGEIVDLPDGYKIRLHGEVVEEPKRRKPVLEDALAHSLAIRSLREQHERDKSELIERARHRIDLVEKDRKRISDESAQFAEGIRRRLKLAANATTDAVFNAAERSVSWWMIGWRWVWNNLTWMIVAYFLMSLVQGSLLWFLWFGDDSGHRPKDQTPAVAAADKSNPKADRAFVEGIRGSLYPQEYVDLCKRLGLEPLPEGGK